MTDRFKTKWQRQRHVDDLKRTEGSPEEKKELEQESVAKETLESPSSCDWCGRRCKPNAIGYCGMRCAMEHLGRERAEALAQDAFDQLEQERKKWEALRLEEERRPKDFWDNHPTFAGLYIIALLLATVLGLGYWVVRVFVSGQ